MLILHIDDDHEDQFLFATALQEIEPTYILALASNGPQALAQLHQNPDFVPEILFLDFNLPLMDGLECLQELQQIPRLHQSDIYILSNSIDPATINRAENLGASGFIIKPSNYQSLVNTLRHTLHHMAHASHFKVL